MSLSGFFSKLTQDSSTDIMSSSSYNTNQQFYQMNYNIILELPIVKLLTKKNDKLKKENAALKNLIYSLPEFRPKTPKVSSSRAKKLHRLTPDDVFIKPEQGVVSNHKQVVVIDEDIIVKIENNLAVQKEETENVEIIEKPTVNIVYSIIENTEDDEPVISTVEEEVKEETVEVETTLEEEEVVEETTLEDEEVVEETTLEEEEAVEETTLEEEEEATEEEAAEEEAEEEEEATEEEAEEEEEAAEEEAEEEEETKGKI